jgi:hypothetical protein
MTRETRQAKIDPEPHERMGELIKSLKKQGISRTIDTADVLSALVMYTHESQLRGMLTEYWAYLAKQDNDDEDQD